MSTLPMLTTEQAYQAMFAFVEAYWKRGGRTDDQVAELLSWMQGESGQTADPAMWADWLDAIGSISGFQFPEL